MLGFIVEPRPNRC